MFVLRVLAPPNVFPALAKRNVLVNPEVSMDQSLNEDEFASIDGIITMKSAGKQNVYVTVLVEVLFTLL
jgi:hypothetical protein